MGGHVAKGSGPNKKLAKRAAAENVLQVRIEKQGATAPVLTHVCVVPMKVSSSSFRPLLRWSHSQFRCFVNYSVWTNFGIPPPPLPLPPHVLYGKGVQNSTKRLFCEHGCKQRGKLLLSFSKKSFAERKVSMLFLASTTCRIPHLWILTAGGRGPLSQVKQTGYGSRMPLMPRAGCSG